MTRRQCAKCPWKKSTNPLAWVPGSITLVCLALGYPFFRATEWLCDQADKGAR